MNVRSIKPGMIVRVTWSDAPDHLALVVERRTGRYANVTVWGLDDGKLNDVEPHQVHESAIVVTGVDIITNLIDLVDQS